MSFQKILVAIDDSPLCPKIFASALELAQSNNAAIMLLHCLTIEMTTDPMTSMALDTGLYLGFGDNNYKSEQALVNSRIEEAQALLKHYSQQAMSQGVLALSNYKVGEAGRQLCEIAEDWGADLIVVGRRGHKGLAEALLGSVSNYVVHHAPCSVLVIQQVEPQSPAPEVTDRDASAD